MVTYLQPNIMASIDIPSLSLPSVRLFVMVSVGVQTKSTDATIFTKHRTSVLQDLSIK